MASKINWNILLISGAVLGGLYLYNKTQTDTTSQNYYSGVTGQPIEEVTQPTIRTDLRQTARTQRTLGRQFERTQRVEARTDRVEARQEQKTARVEARTNVKQARISGRIQKVKIRQDARTERLKTIINALPTKRVTSAKISQKTTSTNPSISKKLSIKVKQTLKRK